MVHVIAPSGDACISVPAQSAVERIREPLKKQHQGRSPKPVVAAPGEPSENNQAGGPEQCRQRQMITFDPVGKAFYVAVDEPFLVSGQQ